MLLFQIFSKPEETEPERVYSEFSTALERGEISEVTIQGNQLIHSKLTMGHGKCQTDEELDGIVEKVKQIMAA